MIRNAVDSSLLASVGYDMATKDLEVEFNNGQVYRYHGVPAEMYHRTMQAESAGSFFSRNIRNHFKFSKV